MNLRNTIHKTLNSIYVRSGDSGLGSTWMNRTVGSPFCAPIILTLDTFTHTLVSRCIKTAASQKTNWSSLVCQTYRLCNKLCGIQKLNINISSECVTSEGLTWKRVGGTCFFAKWLWTWSTAFLENGWKKPGKKTKPSVVVKSANQERPKWT